MSTAEDWDEIPSLDNSALSVPHGWRSVKSSTWVSTDLSVALIATQRSGADTRTTSELASQHATEIVAAGGQMLGNASEAIALAGRDVTVQTFVMVDLDGARRRVCTAYHSAPGVETVVSTMVSLDDAKATSRVNEILHSYDPWPAADGSDSTAFPGVEPCSGSTLGLYSHAELLAAARLIGLTALPAPDDRAGEVGDSPLATLIARGVVRRDDSGGLALDAAVERSLRALVAPTTLISIESGPPGRTRTSVIHVDANALVTVRSITPGVLQLDSDSSDQLDVHLEQHLDLREADAALEEPTTVDGFALDRVRAGDPTDEVGMRVLAFSGRVIRVRSLISGAGAVTGGELTVLDGGADGYWVVDNTAAEPGPVFACRPISSTGITDLVADLTTPHPSGAT